MTESAEESLGESYAKLRKIDDPAYLPTVSMKELYDTIYPGKPTVIEGLLRSGTYIFAGAPKIGKSFMAAQIAYHVSRGIDIWGYHVHKGTVLYLALEDDFNRLQERLYRMFGTEVSEDFHISVQAKQLGQGLDAQIEKFIFEHPSTNLIIIDTLQKVREIGSDKYSYQNDYEVISKAKQLSDRHKICIMLVHHTRKQQAEDKFDTISGTNGLSGAADGAWVMYKDSRASGKATIEVTGRDIQSQLLYLVRDEDKLTWQLERAEQGVQPEPPEPVLEAIAALVTEDCPEWSGSATQLAEALGVDIKPNALSMLLTIRSSKLLYDYSIKFEKDRSHSGRIIKLRYIPQA